MMTYRDMAWEVAAGQYGYIGTEEAREAGIPPIELVKLAHRGRLQHVGHGLYKFRELPPTRFDQFYEATRRVGAGAHLVGDAVLALHDLAFVNPRRIRVGTTRRRRGKLPPWIEVVRDDTPPEKLDVFELIPTATVVDAIRDCQHVVMADRLSAATQQALAAHLVTPEEAAQLYKELGLVPS